MRKFEVAEMKQSASAKRKLAGKFVTYGIVIAFYIIIQALNGAGMVSPSIAGQLVPICAYVTMAVSLRSEEHTCELQSL